MKTLHEIYSEYSNTRPGKGGDKGTLHSYIDYYEGLFENDMRDRAKSVVEIGVHTGHSIAMFDEYFYNADVVGIELNQRRIDLSLTGNCDIIIGDATQEKTFEGIDNIDVVIDDGSHKLEHQLKTFEILFPRMNKNGIYCIEDILDFDKDKETLLNLHPRHEVHDGREKTNNPSDVIVSYFHD